MWLVASMSHPMLSPGFWFKVYLYRQTAPVRTMRFATLFLAVLSSTSDAALTRTEHGTWLGGMFPSDLSSWKCMHYIRAALWRTPAAMEGADLTLLLFIGDKDENKDLTIKGSSIADARAWFRTENQITKVSRIFSAVLTLCSIWIPLLRHVISNHGDLTCDAHKGLCRADLSSTQVSVKSAIVAGMGSVFVPFRVGRGEASSVCCACQACTTSCALLIVTHIALLTRILRAVPVFRTR